MNGTENRLVFDSNIIINALKTKDGLDELPDAIIAATAVLLGAILVTDDAKLLKLEWPGLQTFSIR